MPLDLSLTVTKAASHQSGEISHCNKSCSPPLTEDWRCDVACQCCIVGNSSDALSTPVTVHVWWCCDDITYRFSSDTLQRVFLPPFPTMQQPNTKKTQNMSFIRLVKVSFCPSFKSHVYFSFTAFHCCSYGEFSLL